MIKFQCPFCNEVMEVSDKKAGKFVECIECSQMVEVKELPLSKPRKKKAPDAFIGIDYLSIYEYMLYGAFFVFFPLINLVVGVTMHTFWKDDQKTKAHQILQLSLIIFVIQLIPMCCLCCVPIIVNNNR